MDWSLSCDLSLLMNVFEQLLILGFHLGLSLRCSVSLVYRCWLVSYYDVVSSDSVYYGCSKSGGEFVPTEGQVASS